MDPPGGFGAAHIFDKRGEKFEALCGFAAALAA
jgi:hypothetical protein